MRPENTAGVVRAYIEHGFDKRGTLQPRRLADLAVLDKDYLTVPADELGSLTSLLTMVGGGIVYAAGPFATLGPDWAK